MAINKSNIVENNLGASEQVKLNRVLIEFPLDVVTNSTHKLITRVPVGLTITNLYAETVSGTADIEILIDGVAITGMSGVGVSSTQTSATATALNAAAAGTQLTLIISNNVDGVGLGISIEGEED